MAKHELHPGTGRCLGCGVAGVEPASDNCEAYYGEVGSSLRFVVSIDEELVLWVGKVRPEIVRFDRNETFALRDLIRDGIRDLRERKVSRKTPEFGAE